jgi:hypothetical protein
VNPSDIIPKGVKKERASSPKNFLKTGGNSSNTKTLFALIAGEFTIQLTRISNTNKTTPQTSINSPWLRKEILQKV